MNTEDILKEVAELRKTVEEQGIRITLAQAWMGLLGRGYDALLHYGINYQSLKEFDDDGLLEDARDLPLSRARDKIVAYIGRVHTGINAAIRRKSFKTH